MTCLEDKSKSVLTLSILQEELKHEFGKITIDIHPYIMEYIFKSLSISENKLYFNKSMVESMKKDETEKDVKKAEKGVPAVQPPQSQLSDEQMNRMIEPLESKILIKRSERNVTTR